MTPKKGDEVMFGPPGGEQVHGRVVRGGDPAKVKQTVRGHGQPAGTTWGVTASWIRILSAAATETRRTSRKTSSRARTSRKPIRTSRRPTRIVAPPVPKTVIKPASKAPPQYEAQREALKLAHDLLRKWDMAGWRVEFTSQLTRAMGNAHLRKKLIKFSIPLWDRASDLDRRQTVVHEVAHAVAFERHGDAGHGAAWKQQMAAMGYPNASKYHTVDRTGIKRKRNDTVEVECCGKFYRITFAKLARGLNRLRCRNQGCSGRSPTISEAELHRFREWERINGKVGGVRRNGRMPICACGGEH